MDQEPHTFSTAQPEPYGFPPLPPAPPQKSRKKLWITLGIVAGVLALCGFLCVGLVGTSMIKVWKERGPVTNVLDGFMKQMVSRNVDEAYALFSPRSQRRTPKAGLEDMLRGNNWALFEGYQKVTVQNLNVSATANTNQDFPQGMVANVTGVINYEGDFTEEIQAVLEKVDGQWRIHSVHVTVPPNKVKPQGSPQ